MTRVLVLALALLSSPAPRARDWCSAPGIPPGMDCGCGASFCQTPCQGCCGVRGCWPDGDPTALAIDGGACGQSTAEEARAAILPATYPGYETDATGAMWRPR